MRTRRILWARAGGRCAVCRRPLLPGSRQDIPEAASGEGGCIVTLRPGAGERYDNLILLCEEHAGESAERLERIKAAHEEWVRLSALAEHPSDPAVRYDPRYHGVTLLPRVRSGEVLARLLGGVHSVQYDRDEPGTPGGEELGEALFQYIRSITEVWAGYDAAERRRVVGHLEAQIAALDRSGLLLFGLRYAARARIAGTRGDWSILRLWLLREGADSSPTNG
ncbi:MAG: hypothetical protein JW820_14780 [Spirochaetales bacterium]|nr:hypothetical protein [Spirochaetales bacterium]